VASLSQGRTAAAQCGLFTHKSVPVIFEPPCINYQMDILIVRISLSLYHENSLRKECIIIPSAICLTIKLCCRSCL